MLCWGTELQQSQPPESRSSPQGPASLLQVFASCWNNSEGRERSR